MDRIPFCLLGLPLLLGLAFEGQAQVSTPVASFESRPVALAPEAVASFGAAVHRGSLYVLGGARGRAHRYHRESQSGEFCAMNLHDPADWRRLPSTAPLQSVALVSHGDALFRVGGMRAVNPEGEKGRLVSVDEFARFRPGSRRWEALPPLPRPRSSHDAVVVGHRLFVIGGWCLDGDSQEARWCDRVLSIDLDAENPAWKSVATTPFKRRAIALAAIGEHIYVIGGLDENGKPSARVNRFDTRSAEWSDAPDFPARGLKGFGASAFGVAGRVIASASTGEVYALEPGAKAWTPAGKLAFPRFFHRLVPDGTGGLYAIGGAGSKGRIRHIEHLVPTFEAQACSVTSFTVPHPGRSKNRQGILKDGNRLLFFGGNRSLGQHAFEAENFLAEAWQLDLGTLATRTLPSFPVRRQSMLSTWSGTGRDAKGWVYGGFGHDGKVARSFAEFHRYDPRSKTWTAIPSAKHSRTQAGFFARGKELWIFGGLDYDPTRPKDERFAHQRAVLRARSDAEEPRFEESGVTLPRSRRAFGGALLDDRYYLVGGIAENFHPVAECEVFDFRDRSWSTIPAPSTTRLNPQMVALNGRLYLAGGSAVVEGKRRPMRSIECYDPNTRRWTICLEETPLPSRHLRMFAHEGRLVLVSTLFEKEDVIRIALVRPPARPQ